MTVPPKAVWIARWLAPLGWLVAAVLLVLWVFVPATRPGARPTAWAVGLCVVAVALGSAARLRHGHPSTRFRPELRREPGGAPAGADHPGRPPQAHPPRRYRGLSHSGERPRFD
jgi:hypothetical protein